MPLEGLPNWPAILTVLRALKEAIRRFKKPYVILSKKECKYLRLKLKFVASLVFNSAEARAAMPMQEVRRSLCGVLATLSLTVSAEEGRR